MLRILHIEHTFTHEDTGEKLFKRNPDIEITVEAPIYWWATCDLEKFYFDMPKDDFKYCFDAWDNSECIPFIANTKFVLDNAKLTQRQLLQILPLSTIVTAKLEMSYQKICEVCENYCCGEYDFQELYNQWPTSREWTDFCETLMDIKGVREIIEKEGIN